MMDIPEAISNLNLCRAFKGHNPDIMDCVLPIADKEFLWRIVVKSDVQSIPVKRLMTNPAKYPIQQMKLSSFYPLMENSSLTIREAWLILLCLTQKTFIS